MISTIQIHHLGILVSDLKKGREFYGNILRLEEIERPDFYIPGIWYQLGPYQLHLMLCEEMKHPQHHPECLTVQTHFALQVPTDEFHAAVLRLKNANIKFVEEPSETAVGKWQVFIYDFDHNMIEFIGDSN